MALLRLGDIEIYWECHGEAEETLLLVSGLGGGIWSKIEEIQVFSRYYRVIAAENLGAGRSSMPDRPYSLVEMADHLAAVLEEARVNAAHVVGLSMGGMIAQELALRHPGKVKSLVLGCTHCGGSRRIPPPAEVIARLTANAGLTAAQILAKNLPLLVGARCLQENPPPLQRYRQRELQAPVQPEHALQRQLQAIREFDASGRLQEIGVPTLIIAGGEDLLVPPENSKILAAAIPGAKLVIFPECGHLVHVERPEEFHRLVLDFLRQGDRRSA